ncbi:MAG: hypothetical protein KF912_11480 [Phycisphaeraceae bacterium]|nr:hypothetical protein [Phycisphaeraceae bacterium]
MNEDNHRGGAHDTRRLPVKRHTTPEERRAAIEETRRLAAGNCLNGLRIKALIAKGRR